MLEAIRKRSASVLVKLLFGLLILSFAAWGIGDMIRGSGMSTAVAKVGSVEIDSNALDIEVRSEMRYLQQALGASFDPQQIPPESVARIVIRRLVERTLLDLGAQDLKILVSDNAVAAEIRRSSNFRNQFGSFDRGVFQQVASEQGLSEDQLIEALRGEIARNLYIDSLIGGAAVPKALAELVYLSQNQRRTVSFIRIADEAMTLSGEPSKATLSAFHKDNAVDYTAPQYRALAVLILDAKDLEDEVAVSQEELKIAYEERINEFIVPEQRTIQIMTFPTASEAAIAYDRLREGLDFLAAGKELLGLDANALSLGSMTRAELPIAEVADLAFSLKLGAYSEPRQSSLGWHVVRVSGIKPGREQGFKEAKPLLGKSLRAEKAVDAMYELSNRVEDTLGGGAVLEEAALAHNLKIMRIAAIDAAGRDMDGKVVEGLPGGDFLKIAFATPKTEESLLTEAGPTSYFIVRVDDVTAPALRPLDAIQQKVTADWKVRQRAEASKATANALLEKLKAGASMAAVAKEAGWKVATSGPFDRKGSGDVGGLPLLLVKNVFGLSAGQATLGRDAGAYFIARLESVVEADLASDSQGLSKTRMQLVSAIQGDLLAQLGAMLRARYPVSVNQAAIQRMYDQQ